MFETLSDLLGLFISLPLFRSIQYFNFAVSRKHKRKKRVEKAGDEPKRSCGSTMVTFRNSDIRELFAKREGGLACSWPPPRLRAGLGASELSRKRVPYFHLQEDTPLYELLK